MSKIVLQEISKALAENKITWLITVIETEGSTPGKLGAKMLVDLNGEIVGTIGGGGIEKCVIQKILQDKPKQVLKWNFDLGGGFVDAEKLGMICGGRQEVLVDPLFNRYSLYIIGGGHCGRALSCLAAKCDFNVIIIDDRENCVNSNAHPHASKLICADYGEVGQHLDFSCKPFIVVMTQEHKNDELVMRQILGKPYKYLGVIGSKKKSMTIFKRLLADGYSEQELSQVFMPIGFNIGSQTPNEIAVSILAQLLAVRSEIYDVTFSANPL